MKKIVLFGIVFVLLFLSGCVETTEPLEDFEEPLDEPLVEEPIVKEDVQEPVVEPQIVETPKPVEEDEEVVVKEPIVEEAVEEEIIEEELEEPVLEEQEPEDTTVKTGDSVALGMGLEGAQKVCPVGGVICLYPDSKCLGSYNPNGCCFGRCGKSSKEMDGDCYNACIQSTSMDIQRCEQACS